MWPAKLACPPVFQLVVALAVATTLHVSVLAQTAEAARHSAAASQEHAAAYASASSAAAHQEHAAAHGSLFSDAANQEHAAAHAGSSSSSGAAAHHTPPPHLAHPTAMHHVYVSPPPDSFGQCACDSRWLGACPPSGTSLVGTDHAQRWIAAHQRPTQCRAKLLANELKVLTYPTHGHGIGSQLSVLSSALAIAMNTDRVLVVENDVDNPLYDASFCGPDGNIFDCYFEGIGSCTPHDIDGLDAQVFDPDKVLTQHANVTVLKLPWNWIDTIVISNHRHLGFHVPLALAHQPYMSFVNATKRAYWWRAQSIAYVARPNARVLQRVHALQKRNPHVDTAPGAIAVHVRHGDKMVEAALATDAEYLAAADGLHAASGGALRRAIFLSTQDSSSLHHFQANASWAVHAVKQDRWHESTHGDFNSSWPQHARDHGPLNHVLHALVDITFALQCDGWVLTLSSNFGKVIDMLRSTVACKAGGLFVDAVQGGRPTDFGMP